jgi:spore maturation protein CgeB
MEIVIFGLTVSSSWGNGHAALWRGLIRALQRQGHRVTFFERDQPFYASTRDLPLLPDGAELVVYKDWEAVRPLAGAILMKADAGIITSYCPDGIAATDLVCDAQRPVRCFYDMDTPVTLARIEAGENLPYIGPEGLASFDLVLSYTGGAVLETLRNTLGARRVMPLYGWVDPELHHPDQPQPQYAALLSYIGTYAADRQPMLNALLLEPARRRPADRFVIAGAQYPGKFPWGEESFRGAKTYSSCATCRPLSIVRSMLPRA